MEQDFPLELTEELDDGLARECTRWNRTYDTLANRPAPFHTYDDAPDTQLLDAAKAAGNTILVHLEFGSSIETAPRVSRVCRKQTPPLCKHRSWETWRFEGSTHSLRAGLLLPRLCTVAFARRAICRELCPGMYPSFVRLALPETGEVLLDTSPAPGSAGAPAGEARLGDAERTLASYDVRHQSMLQLDVMEGNIFEAIDYSSLLRAGAAETAAGPAAGPAAAGPAAAAGAGAARANPSAAPGQARRTTVNHQPFAVGNNSNAHRPRPAPRPQKDNSRREWTREETIALLKGLLRYGLGRWKAILEDPEFAETLEGRTGVNLKDRWVNLEKAAERNFKDMKRKANSDTELIRLIREAQERVHRL